MSDRNARNTAAASFCLVALACIGLEKWKRHQRRARAAAAADRGAISGRGQALLTPTLAYMADYLTCLRDQCDPYTNPAGYIPLCMSENKLIVEPLALRLMQIDTASRAFSDSSVYCYNNTLGLPGPREAVAYFLAKHFVFPERRDMSFREALDVVRPAHVAFGAGAASLISHLALALAEAGDAVLIPAPYYAAFDADLNMTAGCVAIAVHSSDPLAGPTPEDLEQAATAAEARGFRVRILLVTNPNNPLGTIYPPERITAAIAWARARKMHTILDEIYALSVHGAMFESALRTLNNDLRHDVHHVWALSKDFGASGFRVGTLYSHNLPLLSSVANLNTFSGVSHPMQMIVAEVLADDLFIYPFLDAARQRTRHSYDLCTAWLEAMVVPYVPAVAGIFVYVDFSALLPERSAEGEARFSALLLDAARLILTPGSAQHERQHGMFRLCYCCVPPEVLDLALCRLDRLVGKIRRRQWDNLHAEALTNIL